MEGYVLALLKGETSVLVSHVREMLEMAKIAPFGAFCLPEKAESGDTSIVNLIDAKLDEGMYDVDRT